MESMTGFSVNSLEEKGFILSFRIKSLNSRYLEIKTNLPPEFFQLEKKIREAVQKSFKRGGVEVSASFLNLDLSSSIKELKPWVSSFKKSSKALGLDDSLSLESVLKKSTQLGFSNLNKAQEKKVISLLSKGLLDLQIERKKEGLAIYKILEKDLKICIKLLAVIQKEVQLSKKLLKDQLYKKASQIKLEVPEDRLAIELSLLVEKADVNEELERLKVHFSEFKKTLDLKTDLKGKKLDFYCQELNREANTIGSKIKNANVIKYLMDLKSSLDRLREQVQNIQ